MGEEGQGVTLSEPMEVNSEVRARVRAAGKAPEGMTDKRVVHYSKIILDSKFVFFLF